MFEDDGFGQIGAMADDLFYLAVDYGLDFLSVGFGVLWIWEGDVAQGSVHSKFCNDAVGYVVGFFEVVVGSSGDFVEEE